MATLVLRSAGAAIGTALGGPLGGLIGGALGAVGGAVVDNLLANALASRRHRAPQLDSIAITHADEGAPVRKLWGRMRLGGNVIWCTQFQAVTTKQKTSSSSGKGFGASTTKVTSFELSFAVAFCEGGDDVALGRVWADGNELDLSQYGYHFYNGSEDQEPDSWIESIEGTGAVPAYRGICYLVFNLLPLDAFGNRMPQITAEIIRRPPIPDPDDITNTLRSVCLLPGAGEFVLGTQVYQSSDGFGNWFPENVHTPNGVPDFLSSLDDLGDTLPNQAAVSLVVAWFGTDLRAASCRIVPKVESASKVVQPADWTVAGVTRATAQLVSQINPALLDPTGLSNVAPTTGTVPAFGGTPSDDTVTQAIQAMAGRGLRVQFYPFVMMDVPSGNALPDPYGQSEQAPFPWRGRITCFPGPGQAGTVDKTAAAATQVTAFFAQYAPMVLHYAQLCVAAGGVDSFVIGSELVGLTQLRSLPGDGPYPAVQALKTLAAQVKAIVGPACKVGYAADWTEYHSHRPVDGSNDVIFNMDPLWSDPNIDFIGIDNYLPISDWRNGSPNIDADPVAGPFTIYDKTYLQANIEGGEDYSWYYASAADRVGQQQDTHRRHSQEQALGVSPEGHPELVGQSAFQSARRRRGSIADRLSTASKAHPLHGIRLPGRRQGAESAQRLLRPQKLGIVAALLLVGLEGRSRSARLSRSDAELLARPCADLDRLWRPDAYDRQHVRLGLGCAALSRFPRPHGGLARYAELRTRPLVDRAPRRGAIEVDHRRTLCRRCGDGLRYVGPDEPVDTGARLRDRRADVTARYSGRADGCPSVRRLRERR